MFVDELFLKLGVLPPETQSAFQPDANIVPTYPLFFVFLDGLRTFCPTNTYCTNFNQNYRATFSGSLDGSIAYGRLRDEPACGKGVLAIRVRGRRRDSTHFSDVSKP